MDDQRRGRAKAYVQTLQAWSEGKSAEEAQQVAGDAELCDELYATLGPLEEHKAWLAASLAHTLKAFAYEAQDLLDEASGADFVCGVYRAALDRDPLTRRLAKPPSRTSQWEKPRPFNTRGLRLGRKPSAPTMAGAGKAERRRG